MSENMLGRLPLSEVQGPRADFEQKLAGNDGETWLEEFKKFLRKEPCWSNGEVAPVATAESTVKFALLVDLGIITVPDDYVHGKRLTTFGKQNRKKFYYYNDEITDQNFPNPARVLKPGDKLRVRAFKQVVGDTTTSSDERLAFLATQKAIHTGAQGASLVFDQKRDQLPKGKWYASFDEPDRLWQDAGYHGVPSVSADSDGGFRFSLGYLEDAWDDDDAFLCFCDLEPSGT